MKTVAQRAATVLAAAATATAGSAIFGARDAAAQAASSSRTTYAASDDALQSVGVGPSDGVVEEASPNSALISSGLFTLAVPYMTSVVVATQSDHAGDNNLYIPVAGPWLDLGNRGGCGAPNQPTCDNETTYKVLLIADGVLQGIGALEVLGGLLVPEHRAYVAKERPRTKSASAFEPHVRIAPTPVGRSGYGVTALGTF